MNPVRLIVAGCLLVLLIPMPLHAQTTPSTGPSAVDAPPEAKFRFGPLGLTPRIAVKNLGVDTNPLNESGDTERDFTATVVPGLDSTLRIGRGRLTGRTAVEWYHFNKSRTQRSFNLNQQARFDLVLNRLSPFVSGGYLRTRQRPTPEIDLRVQQNSMQAGVGTVWRAGARTRFDIEARRQTFEFGDGRYGDRLIADALNRQTEVASVSTRFTLTPLTTFVLRTEAQRDRFKFSAVRNSDAIRIVPGFELKPAAMISGHVFAGFRRFDALDSTVPDYAGVVGEIDASYIWRDATQVAFLAARDIEYSIERLQPYYVMTSGTASVTQLLGLNWFVVGRIGETRLDYRDFIESASPITRDARGTDRMLIRGCGIGRRLGEDLRVGVDLDYVRRRSPIATQHYEGYRFGGFFTYGS